MRDLLGVSTSAGHVHDVQQWAAQQAGALNRTQDLSGILVGLHDEIFQGARPVLAGVDAGSTYCYLLAAEVHRDGNTWGVHLLDAAQQRLAPEYTIADAGQGLRAGQKAAWGDTPCDGYVFHLEHQCETLANTLSNLARGARSGREKLEVRISKAQARGRAEGLAAELEQTRRSEAQAHRLARDIRTLTEWLRHDIPALAGPCLATRQTPFDFIVEQLREREALDARRIRPVRIALQNQRDDLLAFAGVLDGKLAAIAQRVHVPEALVRAAPQAAHLAGILAGMGPAARQTGRPVPRRVRRGVGGHCPHAAQQCARRKSKLAAAQLFQTASPSGRFLSRPAALFPQSPALHAQPPGRASRRESV
jgi:hypothetical protein